MKRLRVALVDLTRKWVGVATGGGYYPSPSIEYLAAVTEAAGHDPLMIHQIHQGLSDAAVVRQCSLCDVVGFSAVTYNYHMVIKCAQAIKRISPNTIIVVGGNLPSGVPQIFKRVGIDLVVIGEGESTFKEVLERVAEGQAISGIAGTAHNTGTSLEFAPSRERIHNLDLLPFPLHDLEAAKKSRVCGVWDRPIDEQAVASVTYSRGCSGKCKFCSSSQVWGRQAIWRSALSMSLEIRKLIGAGVNSLQFSDPTFNISPQRVRELCKGLINLGISTSWFAFCDPGLANQTPELLNLMYNAGCRKVGLGIEDPYIRSSVKKRSDNFERVRRYIRAAHEAGIIVRAYLFIGHPEQYARNYLATSNFLREEPVDEIRITMYTPLPGTESWSEMEACGALLTRDLRFYDTNHLVIKSRCTPQEAVEIRRELARSFYNSREYQERKALRVSQGYSSQTYEFLESHLRRGGFMD